MGTYKVIQDIESEDKLLGPLSLRQFIYAVIVVVCLVAAFKLITIKWFLAIPFFPFIAFFGLLAAPFGHDQSSEVWLLAKIRFAVKPRKRIWNQSGIKDLVTITIPKKIEHHFTNNLSQDEVRNRLSAIANTVDTRGWAVKNVSTNLFQQHSDRLVSGTDLPKQVRDDDIKTEFDILDYYDNPTVQHVDELINSTEVVRHKQLVDMMNRNRAEAIQQTPTNNGQWFADNTQTSTPYPPQQVIQGSVMPSPSPQPMQTTTQQTIQAPEPPIPRQITPAITQANEAVQNAINQSGISIDHTAPITPNPPASMNQNVTPNASPMTAPTDPAIINLANNDDLDIATIARQADKVVEQNNGDEVVVSLH